MVPLGPRVKVMLASKLNFSCFFLLLLPLLSHTPLLSALVALPCDNVRHPLSLRVPGLPIEDHRSPPLTKAQREGLVVDRMRI